MAALGSQSIASSYEQLLHVDRDGGGNTTTHVSVKDGDNGTTFGFTIASDALMMTSTNRLEFGDTGTYIHQSADGVLDLVSDTEIEINATTIDMNGALDLSGNAQLSGTVTVGADGSGTDVIFYSGTAGDSFAWDASEEKLTITGTNGQTALDIADGNLVVADNIDLEGDMDINGTLEADAITVGGTALATFIRDTVGTNMLSSNSESGITVTYDTTNDNIDFAVDAAQTGITSLLAADIKIGEDDETKIDFETANEIHLYANNTEQVYVADNIFGPNADSDVDLGATGVRWKDAFVDSITVTGEIDGASLDIEGNADINGTTNLDAVDIDGAVQIDNTVTVGADDQGYDVIFYGDTASSNMTWDTSADDLILNDSRLLIDQDDNVAAFKIDSEGTTTNVFTIEADALTTGAGAYIYSNSSSTGTRNLLEVQNDHASATGTTALKIKQDADQKAFVIDSAATTNHVVRIDGPLTTTGVCLLIDDADALTTGNMLKLHSNSSTTNTRELLRVHSDHTSASGATPIVAVQDAQNWAMKIENGNTTNSYGMLIAAGNDTADAAIQIVDKDSSNTLMVFDGSGAMRMPKAPAFLVTPTGSQNDIALNSDVAATFGTEAYDVGGNWSTDTFTAPVTGKYQFNVNLSLSNIDTGADSIICTFNASNRSRSFFVIDPDLFDQDGQYSVTGSILMDMDASDTMIVRVRQNAGTQQMDIDTDSTFSGFLAC